MAYVVDRATIRLEERVAEELRLQPGERLVVRIVDGGVIIVRPKRGAYREIPRRIVEEALREVEEGEDLP